MVRGRFIAVGVALALVLAIGLTGCRGGEMPAGQATQPRQVAERVTAALKAKDGAELERLVHPRLGVRFSPYASVDTSSDVVLTAEEAARLWKDPTVRTWGAEDGSGEPIALTGAEYCRRFVWDRDYGSKATVSVNADRAAGNTVNNAAQVYRDGVRVEYYIDASSADGGKGNDWSALRLVFVRSGDAYYLVGIIHDQWTI